MACPTQDELQAFAKGAARSDEESVRSHISDCVSCHQQVVALGATAEELVKGTSASAPSPEQLTASLSSLTAPAAEPKLERGALIGRYVVLDVLGEGGMGVVYSALDPELGRRVALKFLQAKTVGSRTREQTMLLREAQALAKLSHPNVVGVHDVGTLGDRVFIAMEFVEGMTLREWLTEHTRTLPEKVRIFKAAGEGLAAAHAAGLVHRDFKPDNVIVGLDGRVRVMDFGLARAVEATSRPLAEVDELASGSNVLSAQVTQAGRLMGTPAYMAPEQYLGLPVDARTDQFAFGVAFHEALYGVRPFRLAYGRRPDGSKWRLDEPPEGTRVPAWLRRICFRALAERPEDRYGDLHALLRDLEKDPALRWRKRLSYAGVALGAAGLLGLAWAINHRHSQLCRGADERMVGVWDGSTQAAVQNAFASTQSPLASDAFERLKKTLDAYSRGWISMRTEACEATRFRGDQTEEVLSLRMECLDGRLNELKSLVAQLVRADEKTVIESVKAVHGLGELSGCADVAALRAEIKPPARKDVREQVDALRTDLARVKAIYALGKTDEARRLGLEVVKRSTTLGYRPLEADALYQLGEVQSSTQPETAISSLQRAIWASEASHDDPTEAMAVADLIRVNDIVGHRDEGSRWVDFASAAVERAGKPPRVYLHYLFALTYHYDEVHDSEKAMRFAMEATEIAEEVPRDDPERGFAYHLAGNAFMDTDPPQAIAYLRKAVEIREQLLGAFHPETSASRMDLALAYTYAGQHSSAETYMRRAEEMMAISPGRQSIYYAAALLNLGETLHNVRKNAEARARLEDAMRLAEPKLGRSNPRICGIREDLVLVDLDARDPRARADALAALRCHGGVSPNETDVLRAKALLAAAEGGAQSTATLKTILASLTGRPGLARGDLGLVQLLLAQRLASDRQSPRQMAALARESAKNLAATHFGREQVLASALLASTMTGGSRFE